MATNWGEGDISQLIFFSSILYLDLLHFQTWLCVCVCGLVTLYWYVGSSLFHGSGLLVLFQLNIQINQSEFLHAPSSSYYSWSVSCHIRNVRLGIKKRSRRCCRGWTDDHWRDGIMPTCIHVSFFWRNFTVSAAMSASLTVIHLLHSSRSRDAVPSQRQRRERL